MTVVSVIAALLVIVGVVLILEYFDIICVVSKFWRFIVHNILFGFIL